MPSKIKRSQIQLTDLVSTALATDASGNIIAGSAGWDMLKSENLSGLANNATARSNIGLGNVDNTSDANKPVSTAQATAIGLKANTASPTFTGTVTLPAGQVVNGVTLTTGGGTTNFLRADGTYAAPAGGAVASVFWRTGSVVATAGDYTAAQITNTPSGTIASTTVQWAIFELEFEKQPKVQFQDEWTNLGGADVDTVNFTGTWVTASRSGNTVTVNASGGASTFWTTTPWSPARATNSTFTVTDTANANKYDLLLQRGTQVKWLETSVEKRAMIVSATYSSNTVTVTMVGDIMASIDASSLKYHNLPAKTIKFQYPLTTAVATDVCAPFQSDKSYRVYGAKVHLATAGVTGSSTYDINKGGVTMFTTQPTLATGVTASADFTANNGTSLASGDIVTIDIDAISTTAGVGLTVDLYLGESQLSQQA